MIRQRLARLLYPYGSVRRVLRGGAAGVRYEVGPGMGVSYSLGRDGMHLPFLRTKVHPGMTVYDVGANRGQMALALAHWVGPTGRVVCIEPVKEVFQALQRNVVLNGFAGRTGLHQAAASDHDGTVAFYFPPADPTQGKVVGVEPAYEGTYALERAWTLTVPAVRLDTLAGPPPDLIKFDVEGALWGALRGAEGLLDAHRPAVFAELHGPEEHAAIAWLQSKGYRVETLDGTPVEDPTAGWFSPVWCTSS